MTDMKVPGSGHVLFRLMTVMAMMMGIYATEDNSSTQAQPESSMQLEISADSGNTRSHHTVLTVKYEFEDVFVPSDECEVFVQPNDHVLIEYDIIFQNGSVPTSVHRPDQLFYFQADGSVCGYAVAAVPTLFYLPYFCRTLI
jgi:hypothetical protein